MSTVPLNKVFTVNHGNKFDLNKMSKCEAHPDAVAFIGRTGERNGFVAFVEKLDGVEPFAGGLITVALGGSALSSFVQSRPFYTAQNIDVLTPRHDMPLDVKLYYCLCIEANRFRYSTFGREANRTLKNLLVPPLEAVPSWVAGISTQAVEELRHDLSHLVTEPTSVGTSSHGIADTKSVATGPKPEVLKIHGDWQDAVKQSLQKTKPEEGWPK